MKLPDFAVNRPVTIVMIVLAVLILGAVSLKELTIDLFPELNLPYAAVITNYTGAGPEEVEKMVTQPLEEILGTVNNLKGIQSFSSKGSSTVGIEFESGTDMNFATLQMREKVDMVKGFLPEDAEQPMVLKMDLGMMPVLQLGVSGEMEPLRLKKLVEEKIKPRLERLEGVASVSLVGGWTREIKVLLEPARLQLYGIGIDQVIQSLQAANMSTSGGQVGKGDRELLVRVTGEYGDLEQIGRTKIITPGGATIKVEDVARVEDGIKQLDSYSLLNGEPSVVISVQKQSNANTVQVVRAATKEIQTLGEELPEGVNISTIMDQAKFIEDAIKNTASNLVVGAVLAIFILFVFLRNIPSTLVIGLSMPISVIGTFTLMYFAGLTINMMSLGGLALGIGMMVDSAIVVLENIYRYRQEGLEKVEAARLGANEVANAIIASTLTTVAVFFPIVFVKGIASELFSQLALTVSFSLVASLLVALTLLPMLASRMLKVNGEGNKNRTLGRKLFELTGDWLEGVNNRYRRLLKWCLGHRAAVLILVTVLFLGSLLLVPLIGAEFIPVMDQGMITIQVKLPNGSKLETTQQLVARVEQAATSAAGEEVETVYASIGSSTGDSGGLSMGSTENGRIDLLLAPLEQRRYSDREIVDLIRQEVAAIPGAEITVSTADTSSGMGGFAAAAVEVIVHGDDLGVLKRVAGTITKEIEQVPGTEDVTSSLAEGRPELEVNVDRDRASAYGLSVAQIATATRAAINGQVATRYKTGGEEIDIRVQLSEEARTSAQDLRNLLISSPLGIQVPLDEVAQLREVQGPSTVERINQSRVVRVSASLAGRDLNSVMNDVKLALDKIALPPGYTIEYTGAAKEMASAFGDLSLALILAIVLVYMIMAAQFESLSHPLVVMFSMPVTVIGVLLGLAVTGRTFSVVTFIGVIMLAGIVVNNAIVLVDYINILRRQGVARNEAIEIAGARRLRPILMTALTTILGMVPLVLGLGEGAEAQAPMATAVIGGLTTSTLLTLLVIPVMYSLFDDVGRRLTRRGTLKLESKKSLEG